MTDDQIKHMVDRFLAWKLPADFSPDGGISFQPFGPGVQIRSARREPIGTNLFTAQQAREMIEHLVRDLPI